jgi:hypothetical protein
MTGPRKRLGLALLYLRMSTGVLKCALLHSWVRINAHFCHKFSKLLTPNAAVFLVLLHLLRLRTFTKFVLKNLPLKFQRASSSMGIQLSWSIQYITVSFSLSYDNLFKRYSWRHKPKYSETPAQILFTRNKLTTCHIHGPTTTADSNINTHCCKKQFLFNFRPWPSFYRRMYLEGYRERIDTIAQYQPSPSRECVSPCTLNHGNRWKWVLASHQSRSTAGEIIPVFAFDKSDGEIQT